MIAPEGAVEKAPLNPLSNVQPGKFTGRTPILTVQTPDIICLRQSKLFMTLRNKPGWTRAQVAHVHLLYRVTLVVAYMGWVDYDFGHSSVCLVLLGQMGIWQIRQAAQQEQTFEST